MHVIAAATDAATGIARDVDALMLAVTLVAAFFAFGILTAIVAFSIRYRRGSARPRGRAVHDANRVEALWITIPVVLNLALFFVGSDTFLRAQAIPPDAMPVYVVGKQWMWKTQHPGGRREINTLTVPVGRPIELILTSQDVIHSFYVPAFRIKRDVYPKQFTSMWFEAEAPGDYPLFCAEYCGTKHSNMVGRVRVLPADEWQQWIDAGDAATLAQRGGQRFFEYGCFACHKEDDSGSGPTLVGLAGSRVRVPGRGIVEVDEGYLRDSILEPSAVVRGDWPVGMPPYAGQIPAAELIELVEYIRSLGRDR